MCDVICLKMSLSNILNMVQRRETNLYDDVSFEGLLGFKMGMTIALFQMSGT